MTDHPSIGKPATRREGRAKVTGAAKYPTDFTLPHQAYACLVTSAIAKGHIRAFHLEDAKAVPGVLDILTYENTKGTFKTPPPVTVGRGETTTLESSQIWHDGQIIAVVVAESFEGAREAAHKVRVDYDADIPAHGFDAQGVEIEVLTGGMAGPLPHKGDPEGAYKKAPVKVDAHYSTPTQHHNPMELFGSTAVWTGGKLDVYECSQFLHNLKNELAKQLSMDPKDVHVHSQFIGGTFGVRSGPLAHTALIALAAKRLGRPVKLVAFRDQGFTIVPYRPETRHRVRLAATRNGKLQAYLHEGQELVSRPSRYNVGAIGATAGLYNWPNVDVKVSLTHADRNSPGFMRAPPQTPYMFPLESALDELAYKLNIDPIELRRINDTTIDPMTGLHYTTRSLMKCFDEGAKLFGWSKRTPKPGSMKDGDWLIGMGCASGAYPAHFGPATVRLTLSPQGTAKLSLAALEVGQGVTTAMAIVASDRLGIPVESVAVELGDSELPPAGLAAGSVHTTSCCLAVALACEQMRDRLAQAAAKTGPLAGKSDMTLQLTGGTLRAPDGTSEPLAKAMARVAGGNIEILAESLPPGTPPDSVQKLLAGDMPFANPPGHTASAFGAQFVEVRVHQHTREIRVSRMVGAFAAGQIINPLAANSQMTGGMIWGIGSALLEGTEIDKRYARYTNDNLAEYLLPVNADIGEIAAIFVDDEDPEVNTLGMKSIGELGIAGVNAAVANAVYHATGKRIRDLPIRLENLLPDSTA